MYRNEKPGPGRFRQFMQFDADTVGAPTMAADAEMCMLAADTMEALGIPRGSYVVKVWNRKCLDGVQEASEFRQKKGYRYYGQSIRRTASDFSVCNSCLDKGRKDDSGDFTKGAELTISSNNSITFSLSPTGVGYRTTTLFTREELASAEAKPRKPFEPDEFRTRMNEILDRRPFPKVLDDGLNELGDIQKLVKSAGYADRITNR